MKTSCFLVLFATQVLDVSAAPTQLTTDTIPGNIDFSKTYLQFFKIKDLIEKINIKKFRALQESGDKGIEGTGQTIETESEATTQRAIDANEVELPENLPEIDLTEEAINNDEVNVNVEALDIYQAANEEITTIATVYEEESVITTSGSVIEPIVTELVTEETQTEDVSSTDPTTVASTANPTAAPTAASTESPDSDGTTISNSDDEGNDLLNEIDTGDDKFFISKESVDSAKKYGYKILLKKINGKEVPVGKIKFSFPTLVEIDQIEDDAIIEGEVEVIEKETAPLAETALTEEAGPVTENVLELETTRHAETFVPPSESSTVEFNTEEETITAISVTFLPPPLESVIPTVEALDEYTISEGVKQITEDTEIAIMEIKHQNPTETIVFEECAAPFSDVENMLISLAKIIETQTPMISQILAVGKLLKDETSPEILSRSGARLLKLLEPFLEALVPTELSGCVGESSNAMLISLSGTASQLDTIASNEMNPDRANSLHQSATSLQLAAWIMAQLQSSVHTIYSQEGICGEEDSSTTGILGSLSKAITGYIPIVAMLGNQESLQELKETIQALDKAQADIEKLEANSGTRLPGVECGATFSEMAEALENLADFVEALNINIV